jgi:hypothetical protein
MTESFTSACLQRLERREVVVGRRRDPGGTKGGLHLAL